MDQPPARPSSSPRLGPALALAAAMAASGAATAQQHHFKDWVVACDNTQACEAQGYAADTATLPAALVVRRAAGPGAPVQMRLGFGEIERDSGGEAPQPAPGQPVALAAGDLTLTLAPARDGWVELTAAQVQQLRPQLLRADELHATVDGRRWTVSLAGASAALLKLDDLQGRVGTQGALARRGPVADRMVPPPSPLPLVRALRVSPARPGDAALRASIAAAVPPGECERLREPDTLAQAEVLRVDDQRVMLVLPCWLAAYQGGSGAWLAQDRAPHAPQPVRFQQAEPGQDEAEQPTELSLAREADGRLVAHSAAKGRGIGDCWSTRSWVWDGTRFALIDATASPCRMFSAGGLPMTLWRSKPAR